MKLFAHNTRICALVLWAAACAGVVRAADAPAANQKKSTPAAAKAAETSKSTATAAKDKAKPAADLHDLQRQLAEGRDKYIADSDALLKQLKEATEAQKKAVLEKMEEQKKAFAEVASALAKQIADERRKQRAGAAPRR